MKSMIKSVYFEHEEHYDRCINFLEYYDNAFRLLNTRTSPNSRADSTIKDIKYYDSYYLDNSQD